MSAVHCSMTSPAVPVYAPVSTIAQTFRWHTENSHASCVACRQILRTCTINSTFRTFNRIKCKDWFAGNICILFYSSLLPQRKFFILVYREPCQCPPMVLFCLWFFYFFGSLYMFFFHFSTIFHVHLLFAFHFNLICIFLLFSLNMFIFFLFIFSLYNLHPVEYSRVQVLVCPGGGAVGDAVLTAAPTPATTQRSLREALKYFKCWSGCCS